MKFRTYWSKVWVIRDSEGPGSVLLPEGSKFWLEPMRGNGGIAYYCLRANAGDMHDCFVDQNFYPIGILPIDPGKLPNWQDDPQTRGIYQMAARKVRDTGRQDARVIRVEAPIKVGTADDIARIYCFPDVQQNGRDWMVFDLIAGTSGVPGVRQDGTGNGDPDH